MNQEVKVKLLTALRSGEYKQAFRTLKTYDGCFCIHGVICDLAVKEGIAEWTGRFNDDIKDVNGTPVISIAMTPAIQKWAGIKKDELFFEGTNQEIMDLNDRKRISFNEFADLIEQQW